MYSYIFYCTCNVDEGCYVEQPNNNINFLYPLESVHKYAPSCPLSCIHIQQSTFLSTCYTLYSKLSYKIKGEPVTLNVYILELH